MNFIDLFSGAGGLSEGFIKAGFNPLAHVEIDKAACNTLRTRTAYHYLLNNDSSAFKQIGNAVPPLMASAIALEIKKILD